MKRSGRALFCILAMVSALQPSSATATETLRHTDDGIIRCAVARAFLRNTELNRGGKPRWPSGWLLSRTPEEFESKGWTAASFIASGHWRLAPSVGIVTQFLSTKTNGPAEECPRFGAFVRSLGGTTLSLIHPRPMDRPCRHIVLLSTPVVSPDRLEAMISVGHTCGWYVGGAGNALYLRKDKSGDWKVAGFKDDWIS